VLLNRLKKGVLRMPKHLNRNSEFPQMKYDLLKEMFVALGILGALVLILSAAFSTPDVPVLSAKQVDKQAPMILVSTALEDLAGQDAISGYGPPYNATPDAAQRIGGFSPQKWSGVQIPVNSAQDDVIGPLQTILPINPSLQAPLSTWSQATNKQKSSWVDAVNQSLKSATIRNNELILPPTVVAKAGPVPSLLDGVLSLAQSGLMEASIDGKNGPMPATDRTKSTLLLSDQADSAYADQLGMTGDQWGVIKETGNYPGAVWLWFFTLLYQIPPFSSADSADLLVVITVLIVTMGLVFIPFIPGLRRIPNWLGVYRFIWRKYYRTSGKE